MMKQSLIAREAKATSTKPRTKIEHKHWTQTERLAEAARTELINRKSLEDLLRLEELNKKKAMPVRVFPTGPRVLFYDKGGKSRISFVDTVASEQSKCANGWAEMFKELSLSLPDRDTCAVTHMPARYRDPLTGIPYATVEAFRVIRDLLDDEDKPLLSMKSNSSMGSCHGLSSGGSNGNLMMSNNSNNSLTQQNDSFPQQHSMHQDQHQLQLQILQQQQQQHLHQSLQSSPHPQHLHPFDQQNNPNGTNPHDLSAMQMQYSYGPYSQPYYKDVTYQNPNNPGLAQYHSDYQLQLQLQQLQYPQ
jgi:hypothetical protein